MPRKLRLEYPGAIYHVINRGNYRADIFSAPRARSAFMSCLWAACKKSGWRLHAYVLMRNHFHLALETPQGNLVAGMRWLQATFANRFNRMRGERGHLFQGRYKALVVQPGAALGQLCDYIHLNPVRARVATVGKLRDFRDSSYWQLWHRGECPACLNLETALRQAGGLADNQAGAQAYEKFLRWQAAHGSVGRNRTYVSMSRGWALGSKDFKEELLSGRDMSAETRAWGREGKQAVREARWKANLQAALKVLGRTQKELTERPLAQSWKVALLTFMKEHTQASNAWLVGQCLCPRPIYVSRLVSQVRHQREPDPHLLELRVKCKA